MQIGFFGILALIFITLKLTDYIDWSWWWVLAPIYVPSFIIVGLVVFITAIGGKVKINKK